MSLSKCSQCQNFSEEVCLLGQSYVDVFHSVQTITDDLEQNRITAVLADCSFWEESELLKLISREVTLSHHAWSHIAYMKLRETDQAMFAGLVDVARMVVLSPNDSTSTEPSQVPVTLPPSDMRPDDETVMPSPELSTVVEPEAASAEDVTISNSSTPADEETTALNDAPSAEDTSEPPATENNGDGTELSTAEAGPSQPPTEDDSIDNSTATVGSSIATELDESSDTETSIQAESLPDSSPVDESSPLEAAMTELWTMAVAATPLTVKSPLMYGRGTGRISEEISISSEAPQMQ